MFNINVVVYGLCESNFENLIIQNEKSPVHVLFESNFENPTNIIEIKLYNFLVYVNATSKFILYILDPAILFRVYHWIAWF
jgi:uncharacterized protein YqiB (DUF1249 family)